MANSESVAAQPAFGYNGLPNGAAYEFWREEFGRQLMQIDFVPLVEGPVRRLITPVVLPQVRMAPSVGTPIEFRTMATNDELVLVMSSDSPVHVNMADRVIDLPAGAISLGDAGLKGAFCGQLREGSFKTMLFDRAALLRLCPNAEDAVGRKLDPQGQLSSLLREYYDLVVRRAHGLDALAQETVSRHLMDLAVLLIGAHRDDEEAARQRGLTAARFEALKADILARLSDGSLSLAGVARSHRISTRYVQAMFARAGTSFSEFVLEQRLLRAARLLQDTVNAVGKISEIAFLAGFNDVSYFNQAFRRRFGMTPSDMRAEAVGRR
jgi:AraC-like DNA-binding protein